MKIIEDLYREEIDVDLTNRSHLHSIYCTSYFYLDIESPCNYTSLKYAASKELQRWWVRWHITKFTPLGFQFQPTSIHKI